MNQGPRTFASRADSKAAKSVDLAPALVLTIVTAAILLGYGVNARDLTVYIVYWSGVILLPGVVAWTLLTEGQGSGDPWPARRGLCLFVCGAACGYVIEIAAYTAFRYGGVPRLYWLAEVLILIAGQKRIRAVFGRSKTGIVERWPATALAAVGLFAVLVLSKVEFPALGLNPGILSEPDEMFHLALIGELRHHFPAEYPYVAGEPLTYQYFVHLHTAASSWLTGVQPYVLYRRFDPTFFTLLTVLGVAATANCLTGRRWTGVTAAALVVLVGSFDVSGIVRGDAPFDDRMFMSEVMVHSPTQALAFVLAVPAIILSFRLLTSAQSFNRWQWVGLSFTLLGLGGTKVTFVPMFLVGFVATALLSLGLHAGVARRAFAAAGLCVSVLVLSAVVLYRGSARDLHWQPGKSAELYQKVLQVDPGEPILRLYAIVLIGVVTLTWAAGAGALFARRGPRRDPRCWWLLSATTAGYGAAFLLGHEANSQRYFARSGAMLLAVAAAWGFATLFPAGAPRRHLHLGLIIALAAGIVLLSVRLVTESLTVRDPADLGKIEHVAVPFVLTAPVLALLVIVFFGTRLLIRDFGHGRALPLFVLPCMLSGLGLARSFAFVFGDYQPQTSNVQMIPADGLSVTTYLRAHSGADDIVMTNAHCGPVTRGAVCDSRHFWMTALSQRRFILEGWAYTGQAAGWLTPFWGDYELLDSNDTALASGSPETLGLFAEAHNVRWVLLDKSEPYDLDKSVSAGILAVKVDAAAYTLYEVNTALLRPELNP